MNLKREHRQNLNSNLSKILRFTSGECPKDGQADVDILATQFSSNTSPRKINGDHDWMLWPLRCLWVPTLYLSSTSTVKGQTSFVSLPLHLQVYRISRACISLDGTAMHSRTMTLVLIYKIARGHATSLAVTVQVD